MIPLLRCGAFASVAILLAFAGIHPAMAERMDIAGPVGSVSFGAQVVPLPNGNFVVNDPGYNAPGPIPGAGAVYLFAPNGEILGTLTGAHSGDSVGTTVVALSNGDFVVGRKFRGFALRREPTPRDRPA